MMRITGIALVLAMAVAPRAGAQAAPAAHDLTGVWIGPYTPNLARGMTLPFQPGAEAAYRNHRGEDDPTARCLPPGVPRALGSPFPIEILQDATSVTILYEYMRLIRRVPTDGRAHAEDLDLTFMGDSVGKWDGDTLVIDVVGFNDKTWLDTEGHQHSDALHVVERFRRSGADTIAYEVTIDDPKTYQRAWSASRTLTRHPDWALKEYVCEENNKIKSADAEPVVLRDYEDGLTAVHAKNPAVRLSVGHDAAVADHPVLMVDYPPPPPDPGARDVVCTVDRQDWSGGRAISFQAKADHAVRLSVSFIDRNHIVYTAWVDLAGGSWQDVRLPLDEIRPNPFFQPPDAKTGAPLDVSSVNFVAFAPHDQTSGRISISRFLLSN
jgi:hypothetical protein